MPSGIWLYSYLALWVLLLFVSLLLIAVLRQLRVLHAYWIANDPTWGLPLGAVAPALPAEDLFGRPLALAARRGKKTLLCFLSRGCTSCRDAMERLPAMATMEDLELVLVVSSSPLDTRLFVAEYDREALFPHVLVVADGKHDLMDRYKAVAVPYLVVVDEDGRIGAQGTASALGQIEALIRQTDELRRRRQADGDEQETPAVSARTEGSPSDVAVA